MRERERVGLFFYACLYVSKTVFVFVFVRTLGMSGIGLKRKIFYKLLENTDYVWFCKYQCIISFQLSDCTCFKVRTGQEVFLSE